MVMAYGFKRRDFKKMGVLLAAAGIFVPDMTHLKRCGFFGGAMSKRERLRRAKTKYSVYPIGDGEKKRKKTGAQTKKGPTMGLEPTWVGMSYEQEIGPAHLHTAKNRKARAIKLRL
jgi:hypothetical protein